MLKIRRPLGRLIFNMGIAIAGKTVFLIETAPLDFFRPMSWILLQYIALQILMAWQKRIQKKFWIVLQAVNIYIYIYIYIWHDVL